MFDSLIEFHEFFKTEKKAVNYFIKARWNGKVVCPYKSCDSLRGTKVSNVYKVDNNKIYTLKSGKDFKCSCCGKTFSYKTGTIFENSKISMKKWFLAIYLHTAHKKGLSSIQLAKYLKVRQATAWFMLQRLRHVGKSFFKNTFSQTVEIDEAYIGGSESNKHASNKNKTEKTVVLGMVERESGQVKAVKVASAKTYDLQDKIYANVKDGATICTDSYAGYENLKWNYKHDSVNHSKGEYVKTDAKTAFKIHTNTIEGFWSIVKRTINGMHHCPQFRALASGLQSKSGKKHTQAYLAEPLAPRSEMTVRYNTRHICDASRFAQFVGKVSGLRLKYNQLISVA